MQGLPKGAGIGFKPEHTAELLAAPKSVAFIEIHAENYMGDGGPALKNLDKIRQELPISLHGVGLSIGAEEPLDKEHLVRLKKLIDRYQPAQFSEHLAWSSHGLNFYNDLLPVAYNQKTLDQICAHIDEVQNTLKTRFFLENPSTYVRFLADSMDEAQFIKNIAQKTGCGLLLDVSNVVVSSTNHGYDAIEYIDKFPLEHVGEIHLGGFDEEPENDGGKLLIDSHAKSVSESAWSLYEYVIDKKGVTATLIEWDNDVPSFETLVAEATRAENILQRKKHKNAA